MLMFFMFDILKYSNVSGWRRSHGGDDVTVAVVDVRQAYFHAKPADDTYTGLPDNHDAGNRVRKYGKLKRCLYGTRWAPGRGSGELQAGIKEADLKIGEMSKCTFRSGCGKFVGTMHRDDVLMSWWRSIVEKVQKSLRKRYETRE